MSDLKHPDSFRSVCGSSDTIVSYGGVKLIDPRKIVIHDNCIVQQHGNCLKVTCPDKSALETENARLRGQLEMEQTKTALLIRRCEDLQSNDTFSSSDYKMSLHGRTERGRG